MSNNKRETEANSGPIATSPTKSGSNKKTRELLSVQSLRKLLTYNYEQVALLSFLPG